MWNQLKKLLVVVALIALSIGLLVYFASIPKISLEQVNMGMDVTIADLAYSYTGTMTRPLFPEVTLWFPLEVQLALSCLIVLAMVVVALFFPGARRFVMFLTIAATIRHLLWRAVETLDMSSASATAISIIIYGAEIIAFFAMALGYFQVYGQTDRKPVSLSGYVPEQLPNVDVMVCTYNEPVSVLYRTLVGCQSMQYPNKTVYLLDDGNRDEMRQLAERLGVQYIARSKNEHAKAGNLNNALKFTKGDLVLVFDADHVPCISFLQEVVGFFMVDTELAFVQTPQHFFTEDPFQRNLLARRAINNEQDLFFHVIEPGNDYWGAAFFGGSGAIFRRQALNEIGGFAIETITEDVHTGLRLHAKGWKSIFYNKDLAAGLAQDSFADFIKQRLRWTRGMTQIFMLDNPMLIPGLRLPQRICYLAGIWYFFHGLPRLVFLTAPLFFLLFGYQTINSGFVEVLLYYLPSFTCLILGYTLISRGVRHSFWSEVYETAMCVYMLLTSTLTMLSPRRAKFRVTPKGGVSDEMNFNWRVVIPQLVIASLLILGFGMAIVRGIYTPEYAGGIYTNMFWSFYNLVLLLGGIYVAQERPQFRLAPRISRRIRCEVKLVDGSLAVGYTTNVSESGVAVVFDAPVPISGLVTLKLMDWDINETTVLTVQAVRSHVDQQNRHYVGFNIVNRTDEQHQHLIRHMFGASDIWTQDYVYTDTTKSFLDLMLTPFRLLGVVERPMQRVVPRFHAALSCVLNINGQHLIGFSNDISENGISLFLRKDQANNVVQLGQPGQVRIQWLDGKVSELPAQVARMEDVGGGQYLVGLHFNNLSLDHRKEVVQQIYQPRENLIRVAPSVSKMVNCQVARENGQVLAGYTQEISEMGLMICLKDSVVLNASEKVQVMLHWDEQHKEIYPAFVMDSRVVDGTSWAILYFQGLDMQTMDTLSMRLHAPVESQAFRTLIGE